MKCKVCERAIDKSVAMLYGANYEGLHFCGVRCRNFYENATHVCHLCGSTVEFKFSDAHEGARCIENQIDTLRGEIRDKEREVERLFQKLRKLMNA